MIFNFIAFFIKLKDMKFKSNLLSYNFISNPNEFNFHLGKIIIPNEILSKIMENESLDLTEPFIFKVTANNKSVYLGFSNQIIDDNSYVHYRVLQDLFIEENSMVDLELVKLVKGNKVVFQPSTKDFLEINNHKLVLEKNLMENYSALSVGSNITIEFENRLYDIQVNKLEPEDAVSLYNTDLEVDFLQPADFYNDSHAMNDITKIINDNKLHTCNNINFMIDSLNKINKVIKKTNRKVNVIKNIDSTYNLLKSENVEYNSDNKFPGKGNKLGN